MYIYVVLYVYRHHIHICTLTYNNVTLNNLRFLYERINLATLSQL